MAASKFQWLVPTGGAMSLLLSSPGMFVWPAEFAGHPPGPEAGIWERVSVRAQGALTAPHPGPSPVS